MTKKAGGYMDKRKIFLVIFLAALLAFLTVVFVFKRDVKSELPNLNEQEEAVLQDEEEVDSVELQQQQEDVVKTESPVVKEKVVATQAPVIKHLKVEEVVEEISQAEEKTEDAGVIKDSDSNAIVVTREFKYKSPAKYSFVGFGEQKAPTK